jgi:hypothetical protein
MTCSRCGNPMHPPIYRVTSDIISMEVCYTCSLAARYLERYKGDGELTVVEITLE